MKKPVHVTITGAAGNIGYALAFRVAAGDMLGPDQPVILQLLEITPALDALKGVAMELNDCAFPLLRGLVTTDDANVAFKDCDYALLVGARPRGPGMERKDLLAATGAPDLNPRNFTAMTRLDHNRALSQLAEKTGTHSTDVAKMTIWGNHSSTQYPDISHATVQGKPAKGLVEDSWYKDTFIPVVQQRGAAIIKARGASSAASAASAAIDHIRSWALGTDGDDWVSMGVPSDGSYGIAPGIIYSYPCRCKNGDYEIVQGLDIDAFSREKMDATERELREERAAVEHLLK